MVVRLQGKVMIDRKCSNTETSMRGDLEDREGLVFDIKRYAIHDGPGIRTTAFLKGCPLSCLWCHNPESQHADLELSFHSDRCTGCGACVSACPEAAIRVHDGLALTERERCTVCGACISVCPNDARSVIGVRWTVRALVDELAKDTLFFEQSGGGVTCSGGEPLSQSGFCAAVLRGCQARGIHTAVDTCGHGEEAALRDVADGTDLFLYDVKLIDDRRHREVTGVSNGLLLENLRRLNRWGARIWIRVPLVPGINDDEMNLVHVAELVRTLSSVEALQVLPYHRGGETKQQGLGREAWDAVDMQEVPDAVDRTIRLLSERLDIPVTKGG